MDNKIKQHLLEAPDSHLDASMKPLIIAWDEVPTSLQILEVLDKCTHYALASSFVMMILQSFYDQALVDENVTHESNVEYAKWRTEV
jgi:hypothetical protein